MVNFMTKKKKDPLEFYFPSGVSVSKDFKDFFEIKKKQKKKPLFDF